jgi:hypothetical protein
MELRTLIRGGILALLLAAAGAAVWGLARVDAHLGAPSGPDRLADQPGQPATGPQLTARAFGILRTRPIDGAAFRLLGSASEAAGDRSGADRLYRIAVQRAPRDPIARSKLIASSFAGGHASEGVIHLDVLLRTAPDTGQLVLKRLIPLLGNHALRHALAARMAPDPRWRAMVPAMLADTPDPASAEALLAELATLSPLHPPEVAARVSLLERLGRPLDARDAWRAALPAAARKLDGLVFDGGFESGEGPEPYGWRLRGPPQVAVGLDSTDPAQGRQSLAVIFDGRDMRLAGISQDLVLGVGKYRLQMRGKIAVAARAELFAWVIACRGNNREIASLQLHATGAAWQTFSVPFEVPPGCPTQWLALLHGGRTMEERQVTGRLNFDALEISPEP